MTLSPSAALTPKESIAAADAPEASFAPHHHPMAPGAHFHEESDA